MYKKILLVISLFFLFSLKIVYAKELTFDLVIDQNSVTMDDNLNIKLSNTNLDNNGLSSGQYYITYDTSYYSFTCDDISYKQNVTKSEIDCDDSVGKITIIYVDDDGGDSAISKGEFLNLVFKVKTSVDSSTNTVFTLNGEGFATVVDGKIVELTSGKEISKNVSIEKQKNSDIYLNSLSVDGYDIKFNRNIFEYSLTVENKVSKINIQATPIRTTSTVTGTGEHGLKVGSNKIVVTVTSESGKNQDYILYVNRKGVKNDDDVAYADEGVDNPKTGVYTNIFGIVIMLVIGTLVIIFVRKKNLFPKF